jgi:hypothetical protein
MKRLFIPMLVLVALASATPSRAFKVKRSGILGDHKSGAIGATAATMNDVVVVSASASPSHSTTGKVFVITDVCYSLAANGDALVVKAGGSTLLRFTANLDATNQFADCQHFESGFVVGTGQDVTCDVEANAADYSCAIAGYVTTQ